MRATNATDYRIPVLARERTSTMINSVWSHGIVADAEVIAEIQAHPRHWRALRQHVVRGLS